MAPGLPRVLFALLVAGLLAAPTRAQGPDGWRIDRDLLFHLAVLGDPAGGGQSVPSLGLSPDPVPDITNISLAGLLGLGFPVPARPDAEGLTFYLKFYRYPAGLDAAASARRVLLPLRVLQMERGKELAAWLEPGNVVVKKGVIAPTGRAFGDEDPYPPLRVSGQKALDEAVVFSSLYVTPAPGRPVLTLPGTPAAGSADGVLAFHSELLGLYREAFGEPRLEGGQYRFQADGRTLRLPERPLVFENFRDLPMPQDPERIFLTGLLLVYEDGPEGSRVFEVGSVVRLP